ncbi:hypothetical protein BW686_06550 [Pseudomonas syringae]|uniref:Uncharacterized protein n=1 Tax=Pseudomonas syringae TaxID=317 RepID=A0A244EUV8_PSESX|nr:hypothetical protein [Pseudomonas syringae]MCI3946472.1 hypothetical protein [Pseudomonas syringae]OUM08327.1 hypothetical protein BW686_06550 [Pseudomonas syringae]
MIIVFGEKTAYPAPSVPAGEIVKGKPVNVAFDMSQSGNGLPYEFEVVLINQNNLGQFSDKRPFTPSRPIEIETAPIKFFEVGDRVQVYARLYYNVPSTDQIMLIETPRSDAYDVTA